MLLKKLTLHQDILDDIFESLVKFMYENLANFGEDSAIDGKYLDTYANKYNKEKCKDKISISIIA